jgi:molybdopterin-guanine dinucleotide biosynthesis protein A
MTPHQPGGDGYAAVILAGGAGRRLGGASKPTLPVGGRAMLDRVLGAVADAVPRVVVGPASLVLPPGIRRVSEQPPGGGPVAALAAGLSCLDVAESGAGEGGAGATVAVLAADLPFLTAEAIGVLRAAVRESTVDGAVYVDGGGRRQTLCGVWRVASLRRRVEAGTELHGAAMRDLLAGLTVVEVGASAGGPPPWYDCDSPEDLDRARQWG